MSEPIKLVAFCGSLRKGSLNRMALNAFIERLPAGAKVETIEGVSDSGEIADLQAAFRERNALQCGYCTPGMLLTAQELVRSAPHATREQIREFLSGNLCRCQDYDKILTALMRGAKTQGNWNTFAPVVAGVAQMGYRSFATYNVAGAIAWIVSMTMLGYLLGNVIPGIEKRIDLLVMVIIVVSVIVFNLVADIAYAWLDPRIRLD